MDFSRCRAPFARAQPLRYYEGGVTPEGQFPGPM